jgi:hypothetical protein
MNYLKITGTPQTISAKENPSIPTFSPDSEEITFFGYNVRESTAIMTREWSKELELSVETL